MSQWGAYGYAKHGWTYDAILAHYYQGTTLGPAPLSSVRVLLAQKAKHDDRVDDTVERRSTLPARRRGSNREP